MPLRDHFSKKATQRFGWEGFHSVWTCAICRRLNLELLPAEYRAEPHIFVADNMEEDLFEVRVYEGDDGPLLAAIELIGPGNKKPLRKRIDFVTKCAGFLQERASLVLIDIVTDCEANLFNELMKHLDARDYPAPLQDCLYCCSIRPRGSKDLRGIDAWFEMFHVGDQLPKLPLWLREDLAIPLDLESTYEESCVDLRA